MFVILRSILSYFRQGSVITDYIVDVLTSPDNVDTIGHDVINTTLAAVDDGEVHFGGEVDRDSVEFTDSK